MPPSERSSLVADLFHAGLSPYLAAIFGLDDRIWTLLNVPAHVLTPRPAENIPATIDLVAGPLRPRRARRLARIERRARWRYPRRDQEARRRRLATAVAIAKGLLVPDASRLVAVQIHLDRDGPGPDPLANGVLALGFERVVILVGEGASASTAIVRSGSEDVAMRLQLVVTGEPVPEGPVRESAASKRLRRRLRRLLRRVRVARRRHAVVDLGGDLGTR